MELFYFNKELMPFYLWAFGGILLCVFALCRANRFESKHSIELSQKDSPLRDKHNALLQRLLLGVFIYLFCGVPLVGLMISNSTLCLYGCLLLVFTLAIFSNFSKK